MTSLKASAQSGLGAPFLPSTKCSVRSLTVPGAILSAGHPSVNKLNTGRQPVPLYILDPGHWELDSGCSWEKGRSKGESMHVLWTVLWFSAVLCEKALLGRSYFMGDRKEV